MKRSLIALATFATIAMVGCGGGGVATTPATDTSVVDSLELMPAAALTGIGVQATMATAGSVSTFGQSPTALRARYGLAGLTTPAQQGSGQIIAIISAYHNPNAANDLAVFSAKHGLPGCPQVETKVTTTAGGYPDAIVERPKLGDGCTLQIIGANTNGLGMTAVQKSGAAGPWTPTFPQYDMSGIWLAESTMDIEMAHAMAPMAKIILVEGANNFASSLLGAVKYASSKADIVSMSWGGAESGVSIPCSTSDLNPAYNSPYYSLCVSNPAAAAVQKTRDFFYGSVPGNSPSFDSYMNNPKVNYIAASGDAGYPLWPAVSNKVLAVGGTNVAGAVDTGWRFSGGGLSMYYDAPSYQSGLGYTKRAMPDVAMDADSATPVSVYITPQTSGGVLNYTVTVDSTNKYHYWNASGTEITMGTSAVASSVTDQACVKNNGVAKCGWYGAYGTSVAAPMWAGITAVANAVRAEAGKSSLLMLNAVYDIGAVPGNYVTAFSDVTTGATNYNTPKAGFDLVTGWGVPKTAGLITQLLNK